MSGKVKRTSSSSDPSVSSVAASAAAPDDPLAEVAKNMEKIEEEIAAVTADITKAEGKIDKIEGKIEGIEEKITAEGNRERRAELRDDKRQLSDRLQQLGDEKKQLRAKELKLLEERSALGARHRATSSDGENSSKKRKVELKCDICFEVFYEESKFEAHKHAKLVLRDQLACDSVDSFVKAQHLKAAGWSEDEQLLFVRPEAVELWQMLVSFDKALHIEGPPGTGKSTLAWAWACYKATTQSVLWVHRDPTGSGRVAQLGADGVVSFPAEIDVLSSHIRQASADIVVVDGITSKNDELMGAALVWGEKEKELDRKVVIVSSSQFVLGGEHYKNHQMYYYSMPSWTLKQYESACNDDDFYAGVKSRLGNGDGNTEKIANKFFIAGASARWMFAFDCDELVTKEIPKYVEKLSNMKDLLSGMNGERSATAVNHLVMVNKLGKGFIVSEFAMRLVAEKCEAAFILQATAFAKKFNNPVFDGWVFELDFLLRLRLKEETNSAIDVIDGGCTESWNVKRRESFHTVGDIKELQLETDVWLIPQCWNQGGYDAVQVLDKKLRFVQLTRAATHDLKLDYFSLLITEVAKTWVVEEVEVVFVVPLQADFKRPTQARGSLTRWKWKLDDLRVVEFKRSGQ